MKKMPREVPLDQEYANKISSLITTFKENGIKPKDMKKKRNLALSNKGKIIVIDYGNFV